MNGKNIFLNLKNVVAGIIIEVVFIGLILAVGLIISYFIIRIF